MLRLTQAHVYVSTDVSYDSTDVSTDTTVDVAMANVSTDVSSRVIYVANRPSTCTCQY